jgi:heme-degrading monooxygenase HmoA
MFARLIILEGSPDKADEAAALVNERVIPEAKALPGFAGGWWMTDRAKGRFTTITLWESEDAMAASREAAQRIREGAAQELSARIVTVEEYEVVAQA